MNSQKDLQNNHIVFEFSVIGQGINGSVGYTHYRALGMYVYISNNLLASNHCGKPSITMSSGLQPSIAILLDFNIPATYNGQPYQILQ